MIIPNEEYANICCKSGIKFILTKEYQLDQYRKHKMNCETEGPKKGRGQKNKHLYWSPHRLIKNYIFEHFEFALIENYPKLFQAPDDDYFINNKHWRFSMDVFLLSPILDMAVKLDFKYWKQGDDIFISNLDKYCRNNIALAPYRFMPGKEKTPYHLGIPEYKLDNDSDESKWLSFFQDWYTDKLVVNRTPIGTEMHYQPLPLVDPNKLRKFKTSRQNYDLKEYYEKYPVKIVEPIAA